MSGYLLDTHVILWWLDDPGKLSQSARRAISDPENDVFVSAAAAWEMGIKKSLGRLDIPANLADVLRADSIELLDIRVEHALAVADLPLLHQDPFDRMHVVQAKIEELTLVTDDKQIQRYNVSWIGA